MSDVSPDVSAVGAAPPRPFEATFKLWSKYEDVAMHFNDLILRLRFQALAGVAGFATLVGVFGRDIQDATLRAQVLSGVFALLVFFWVAIWLLDRCYYDKLLSGAVSALLTIERRSSEFLPIETIDLSTAIEQSFLRRVALQQPGWWRDGRWWFYVVVFVALLIGFWFHVQPLLGSWPGRVPGAGVLFWAGLASSVVGYSAVMYGARLLYLHAPPDLGKMGELAAAAPYGGIIQSEPPGAVEQRQHQSRRGFLWVFWGSAAQLAGTVVAAVASQF